MSSNIVSNYVRQKPVELQREINESTVIVGDFNTSFSEMEGAGDRKSVRTELTSASAAAAESLQSCPTLCDPRDGSPPGSPVPGILQAGTLEWVAISFSNA